MKENHSQLAGNQKHNRALIYLDIQKSKTFIGTLSFSFPSVRRVTYFVRCCLLMLTEKLFFSAVGPDWMLRDTDSLWWGFTQHLDKRHSMTQQFNLKILFPSHPSCLKTTQTSSYWSQGICFSLILFLRSVALILSLCSFLSSSEPGFQANTAD